jgi:hypothetical protein
LHPHRGQRSQEKEPHIVADQIFDDPSLIELPDPPAPAAKDWPEFGLNIGE